MSLYDRRFEGRCHVCQFIRAEPEFGELLEAQLCDVNYDNARIAEWFNERFGQNHWTDDHGNNKWDWKYDWKILDNKKLRTHLKNHISDSQEIYRRAREKGMTGNITLEKNVMDMLTVGDALFEGGAMRVANGDIRVQSLQDLMKVMEMQHKMLGGDKVEIKIGGTGGLNIPPQLITSMMQVMQEFVPIDKRLEFRARLDEKVFPLFRQYAETFEETTGRPFDAKGELPEGTNEDIIEGESNEF